MATQAIVNSNSIAQSSTPDPQLGIINPSRNITKEDEAYLRDYTLAAQVISWDEGVFGLTGRQLRLKPSKYKYLSDLW